MTLLIEQVIADCRMFPVQGEQSRQGLKRNVSESDAHKLRLPGGVGILRLLMGVIEVRESAVG
ncbi:MAG: hypothetical protein IPH20_21325 [Bacteroidales bacterium]|nr:hypothetical protein [Bacteroidales bacterium]